MRVYDIYWCLTLLAAAYLAENLNFYLFSSVTSHFYIGVIMPEIDFRTFWAFKLTKSPYFEIIRR